MNSQEGRKYIVEGKDKEIIFLKARIILQEQRIERLKEAAEDLATALIELNPNSSFAMTVAENWEKVRDFKIR